MKIAHWKALLGGQAIPGTLTGFCILAIGFALFPRNTGSAVSSYECIIICLLGFSSGFAISAFAGSFRILGISLLLTTFLLLLSFFVIKSASLLYFLFAGFLWMPCLIFGAAIGYALCRYWLGNLKYVGLIKVAILLILVLPSVFWCGNR